jgi:sulfide:quinone oxidoreductase
VTQPRLAGPRPRGIPCERDGFIPTDAHGCVHGVEHVFAAGDATTFPVRQGGVAAQQADAVAQVIAASVGADIEPQPLRPVLRGLLLTGSSPRYLRADISSGACSFSRQSLWWPPTKLAAPYLAPYLARRAGEAVDLMPQRLRGVRVQAAAAAGTPGRPAPADLPTETSTRR